MIKRFPGLALVAGALFSSVLPVVAAPPASMTASVQEGSGLRYQFRAEPMRDVASVEGTLRVEPKSAFKPVKIAFDAKQGTWSFDGKKFEKRKPSSELYEGVMPGPDPKRDSIAAPDKAMVVVDFIFKMKSGATYKATRSAPLANRDIPMMVGPELPVLPLPQIGDDPTLEITSIDLEISAEGPKAGGPIKTVWKASQQKWFNAKGEVIDALVFPLDQDSIPAKERGKEKLKIKTTLNIRKNEKLELDSSMPFLSGESPITSPLQQIRPIFVHFSELTFSSISPNQSTLESVGVEFSNGKQSSKI